MADVRKWLPAWVAVPLPEDPDGARRAVILNAVSLSVAAILVVVASVNVLTDPDPAFRLASAVTLLLLIGATQWLLRRRRPVSAGHLFTSVLWLVLTVSVLYSGGTASPSSPTLVAVTLIAGLVLGARAAIGYTLASVTFLFGAYVVEELGGLPPYMMSYGPLAAFTTTSALLLFAAAILALGLRQLERALREARDHRAAVLELEQQLLHTQRLESIGLLAGGVAHDFNNLLTVVLVSAEAVKKEPELSPRVGRSIENIQTAAERATALTRQLLAFGRKQLLRPRTVGLNDLVRENDAMLRRIIPERIEIRTVLEESLPSLWVDPGQMAQVIVNLVVNARDAIHGSGTITIRTGSDSLDAVRAHALGLPGEGHYVTMEVEDTGEGIPPEILERIYDPFFTTKPKGRGSGLGLATTLGIVRQTGGAIEVRSQSGSGTTFRIYLPPSESTEESRIRPVEPALRARGGETVLLAEDDELLRRILFRLLERSGYRVLAASDGEAALRIAGEVDGPIHLLITDAIMPGMGGGELVRRIAELRPDTRVLVVTGYGGEQMAELDTTGTPVVLLSKPFQERELAAKVREALGDEPEDGIGAASEPSG